MELLSDSRTMEWVSKRCTIPGILEGFRGGFGVPGPTDLSDVADELAEVVRTVCDCDPSPEAEASGNAALGALVLLAPLVGVGPWVRLAGGAEFRRCRLTHGVTRLQLGRVLGSRSVPLDHSSPEAALARAALGVK